MSESAQFNIQIGDDLTWNVAPLLHEVKHALNKLVEDGKTSIIDLRSIPPVSYTHLTLPTKEDECRSRWSPYH